MKKILIAALATSFALGFSDSYASEDVIVPETKIEEVADPAAETDEPSQNDTDIVIYEIESSAPNKGADYVIIKNNGTSPVNVKDWYIFDSKDYSEFKRLADITLAPGETYTLTEDIDFDFGLGKNDQVRLFNATGRLIREASWEGGHAEEVLRLNPATGLLEDTGAPAEETPAKEDNPSEETTPVNEETPTEETQADYNIVINEVESDDEVEADYVELYNKGTEPVNIKGWYVFDEKDRNIMALDDITINPGEFYVLEKGPHFDFGLGKADQVRLFNSLGSLIDSFAYDSHAHGVWSRYPDGTGEFIDAKPSKSAPNSDEVAGKEIENLENSPVIINEVFQKSSGSDPDYVELKNTSGEDISLKGWYILDDNLAGSPEAVGEGVVIPAGGYYVLYSGKDFSFGLGKEDQVNLFNPEGKLADHFEWSGHAVDQAYSRNPETGEFTKTDPTPGRENTSKTDAELAAEKPVVVNEVESSAEGGGKDYAEIFNRSEKDVDISGWYILDNKAGLDKTTKIKEGTILKAGEFYVFEEGVDFEFGLGSNDEVNLFDKDGKLIDSFAWSGHADGTYGRNPNGFGEFVNGIPSKGRANVAAGEKVIDVETSKWPGSQDVKILDEEPIFDLSDLSGLDNYEGWIYGVNNKEGRFIIFKIENDQVIFAPGFDEKGKAVNFAYDKDDLTKLGPDSEGITVDGKGRVYLAAERDNNNKTVNFNSILQVADPFKDEKVLVADKQWDITDILPNVGANLGIETVEWVGFDHLNGLLYDQRLDKAFDSNNYADAYADGIFFVGMEANGHIYALVLKEDGQAELISDIETGLDGVMGMDYDVINKILWAQADDGYKNIHTLIQFNGTNTPGRTHIDAPSQMNKDLNNEGFVIDPRVDENGNRATYWFMDGEKKGAFRKGEIKADYLNELGLAEKPGEESPEVDELAQIRAHYKNLINELENLDDVEKRAHELMVDLAGSKERILEIYKEAKALSDSRIKVPAPKPSNPPVVVPRPEKSYDPIYVPRPEKRTETRVVESDLIYVREGYKFTKEGYYKRANLLEIRSKLLKSLKENRAIVNAAKLLLEKYPHTVKSIRPELEALMEKAQILQERAEKALAELDIILN